MIVDYLIVSSLYDFSTDLVAQEFEKRGGKYVRLNREEFKNYRLTIDIQSKSLEINIDGLTYQVTHDLKAVYYRQPIFLRNTPGESLTVDEQLARSQWMGFLRSLAIFDGAKWVNPLDTTYLAETKAYQLSLASRIGFDIPKTLIGNDCSQFHNIDGKTIIKSLDTVLLREADDCLFTYSTINNPKELNDENVSTVPLTIQEYVSPKTDIRVTVIGDKLVAVKITSGGSGIENDWRTIDRDDVEYTGIELPRKIECRCFKLLEELKLNYGAIDLIECNGDYYFIEINPTGEWGWLVCDDRRFDIDIVDLLVNDK
jgi:glutathione synthase/RimK-type ligase-like ATP-grasp enzyme